MTSSTLCLHAGARPVSYEELATIEAPAPTATWFPIPHATVLNAVVDTLTAADYRVERLQLALARDNARFFATLDLRTTIGDGVALSVGVRNSIDKSYAQSPIMRSECPRRSEMPESLRFDGHCSSSRSA